MKKFINRNYFWSSLFVEKLSKFGIQHVCISPGSRNTPLTLAFANHKKFKKYIHVDERSSGFFALGISKKINKPVAIVTTSGTAVAELYPAIIEAYNQRIPLIICTADRPEYLRNTGANQTINQENIYKNHIRFFCDFGLPSLEKTDLENFCFKIDEGIFTGSKNNIGPIHFNFPFKKPLEPETFSDEIIFNISDFVQENKNYQIKSKLISNQLIYVSDKIKQSQKVSIFLAWDNFDKEFYDELIKFSRKNNIPIFADGTSDLRFVKNKNENIIINHSAFLQNFNDDTEIILQFGNAPASQSVLKYLENTKAKKISINNFGDLKDPSQNKPLIVENDPKEFLEFLSKQNLNSQNKIEWKKEIINLDRKSEKIKNKFLQNSKINLEPYWPNELLKIIPNNSNLFISNSLPIRDFDYFASKKKNNLKILTNRGASGIDGIISTASGIASQSKEKTFLVLGDLAFYHNLTALSSLIEFKIPLIIILINNIGGGIFSMLPVAKTKNHFDEYFNTSLNLNFSKIVKSFGGNYSNPKSYKDFHEKIKSSVLSKIFSVIEIKTNTPKSIELRKKYWQKIKEEINS
ncbi:MAG: 2-succinyl-5-enolpyruvyl-6-hydroxy-3-cyclohexene-1-carboxylic-acid synthase [Ignavibacteriae bacterium]|nr:2-succinyl-5-enolpyruvyl-6-hydroxy-3-cyclohexene-1-carboxylic-acid synthase [Ignavibacteriota bacterium]